MSILKEMNIKRWVLVLLFAYTYLSHILVILNLGDLPAGRAMLTMSFLLLTVWVLLGGLLQLHYKKAFLGLISPLQNTPVRSFTILATGFVLTEEAITTTLTNLAPLFGVAIGEAYITASTNYFDVVFLHSVIVFIPMFAVLGFISKRYALTPFWITALWSMCGVGAEFIFSGVGALFNAPMWIFVYGLMVYLPAHIFVKAEGIRVRFFHYPIFILLILFSSVLTAWIPAVLNHPDIHFEPISINFTPQIQD